MPRPGPAYFSCPVNPSGLWALGPGSSPRACFFFFLSNFPNREEVPGRKYDVHPHPHSLASSGGGPATPGAMSRAGLAPHTCSSTCSWHLLLAPAPGSPGATSVLCCPLGDSSSPCKCRTLLEGGVGSGVSQGEGPMSGSASLLGEVCPGEGLSSWGCPGHRCMCVCVMDTALLELPALGTCTWMQDS